MLYKTYYILDELGNLQSEGHGIESFETYLSIGLGQDQLFLLILQTLQQLRAVYGDDIDKIVQGNINNIIFLKSTDNDMIDTLSKMSGITHKVYRDGKTVTTDVEKMLLPTEGKISYNMGAKERPLISYNDLAYLPERNSIVFRGGQNPIWNRNETILPMSWRLLKDNPQIPGRDFSFQTMPTMSSAKEFDVRKNQPDFIEMVNNRMKEAKEVDNAIEAYKNIYGYTDYDIDKLDPDLYARDIMDIVNNELNKDNTFEGHYSEINDNLDGISEESLNLREKLTDNTEVTEAVEKLEREKNTWDSEGVYAGGLIAKGDLFSFGAHQINPALEVEIVRGFIDSLGAFQQDTKNFSFKGGNMYSADGSKTYMIKTDDRDVYENLKEESKDPNSNVYDETSEDDAIRIYNYKPQSSFYHFLVNQDNWHNFANGMFEDRMEMIMREKTDN